MHMCIRFVLVATRMYTLISSEDSLAAMSHPPVRWLEDHLSHKTKNQNQNKSISNLRYCLLFLDVLFFFLCRVAGGVKMIAFCTPLFVLRSLLPRAPTLLTKQERGVGNT